MRSFLLALCVVAAPLTVQAQATAVQVEQYRPAPTISDGFAISRPDDRGHLRFGVRLDVDYALNPLVIETRLGDASTERSSLVEHQLTGNLGVSFGLFERLVIFAGLPVSFVQTGTPLFGLPGGDGAGLGDLSLGARGRLVGEPEDGFALALQLRFAFPTALAANAAQRYSGEAAVTIWPELLAELRPHSMVRVTANVGARFRTDSPARIASLSVSHELTFGLGVTVDAIEDALSLYLEGWGSSSFETFGNARTRETTPFEVLLGARGQAVEGLWIGGAVGTGVSRGYGTPDFRGMLTLGYDQGPIREPVVEEPLPPSDRDGDGFIDERDGCPDDPEDVDSWQDEDGCSDPDNDGDGILDGADACVMEPEDADGWEDTDGCPEADNDGDGILDATPDRCLNEAEDFDSWQDADGCPEPDNDLDTILDGDDTCPNEPGPPTENGCPAMIRVDSAAGEILILQSIEFETDRDVLRPDAEAILDEVRAVLAINVDYRIRVEGHTDSRHTDEHNLELSTRRARAVVRWLVAHGIDASRLVGFGCGEGHPIDSNATAAGRQRNRRVIFQILSDATPVLADCREATE